MTITDATTVLRTAARPGTAAPVRPAASWRRRSVGAAVAPTASGPRRAVELRLAPPPVSTRGGTALRLLVLLLLSCLGPLLLLAKFAFTPDAGHPHPAAGALPERRRLGNIVEAWNRSTSATTS